MNVLDQIDAILNEPNTFTGYIPAQPDNVIALFDYSSESSMQHFFGSTSENPSVQVRIRNLSYDLAYAKAEVIAGKLNRYHDNNISITQATPILDIGWDDHNPQRKEFTINFLIRRY